MASNRSRSGPHSSSKPPVGPLGSVPRQHCHVEGRDLTKWAARYAKTFDFEQLFQRNGLVKGERGQGGRYIDCFHDGHSGGQAETYLVNGDETKGFILHCSGASGGCPDISDRLVRLANYIQEGRISIADLEDTSLGGGEVPSVEIDLQTIEVAVAALDPNDHEAINDCLSMIGGSKNRLLRAKAFKILKNKTGLGISDLRNGMRDLSLRRDQ